MNQEQQVIDGLYKSYFSKMVTAMLEAAIAYLHCSAKSFADTDWSTITQIYAQLLQKSPNPFVELNYAIALYYDSQKQAAFSLLHELQQTFLEQYYLLHAALGKLYVLEGDYHKSNLHLTKALSLTNFQAEKEFVKKMLSAHHGSF